MELDTKRIKKEDVSVLNAYQTKISEYEKSMKRYEKEKADIKKDA
jgi:hypothetical protein